MEQPKQEGLLQFQGENIQELIRDPNFPKFYGNGFVLGKGENDLFIMPMVNGKASFMLNMSFSAAKKLYLALQKNIEDIEKQIGEVKSLPPLTKKQ